MPWTYLLECADGSTYVGSTTDLEARLAQHQSGEGAAYTRRRRPVRLLWAGELEHVGEAYALERRLHGWSRAKKLALARGELERLPVLSSRSYAARRERRTGPGADLPR